jgi:transcriptional regulator with XRE-family HTH domain
MNSDESNAGAESSDGEAVAAAVRRTLLGYGFTLYRVAALSRVRFPHQPAYHIRQNFYSQLRSGLTPTLPQLLALAEITDSRLWDWLRTFGFSLGDISRFQVTLARPRTTIVDNDLIDPERLVPFLRYRQAAASWRNTAPLSQLLERVGSQAARDLLAADRKFIYAKIGTDDRLAIPDLLPGSIVRADPRLVSSSLPRLTGQSSRAYFMVEHGAGLICGQLRICGPNNVAFVTSDPSIANQEFRIGHDVRILGVVDLELRFRSVSQGHDPTQIVAGVSASSIPTRMAVLGTQRHGRLLRMARLHAGLSFRSASNLSRRVAEMLENVRYFASPGTLSDYEVRDTLPRQIHKLFTLAIVYGVRFRDLLRAFGVAVNDFDRVKPNRPAKAETPEGFLESIRQELGDLPIFLANALPTLSGLAHISLKDVFLLERDAEAPHPWLRGTRFVLVNRRSKKPRWNPRAHSWSQPVCLLQERHGSYLAASCAVEGGKLMLYAYPRGFVGKQPIGRHIDADVVGQIVGAARFLLSPT